MMSDGTVSSSVQPSGVSSVGFERLDTLVRVTTIRAWVYLATLFAVGASAVVFAVVYRVPTKVLGEGILLIEKDAIIQVRAQGTGRLVELNVNLGEEVEPGSVIGLIAQDDLRDAIDEAESKIKDFEREDLELTQFEAHEKETQNAAIDRVKLATSQDQVNSRDKLKISQRVVEATDRLREKFYLGDLDLLESREKMYEIRDSLNKGNTRLAELELDSTKGENARTRARLERRLKIRQLERKLALDRAKMHRTSRVVSHSRGRVAQVLSARDEMVKEGAPIVLLHGPKVEHGTDEPGSSYDTIVFVPAGEGKRIGVDDLVEVSPATVKREEHGFIRGHVVAISELPATRLAMESALQHPELADAFLKRYAPGVLLRVQVKLDEVPVSLSTRAGKPDSVAKNHFLWSSSLGARQHLKTGTMCQAAIVVERRRLVSLILPWTKTMVGTD